ncbi:short chain oxidoreductase/dehydrogenase [Ilyonectria robusta]
MDTNVLGTMRCIKGVLPHFRSLGTEGCATIVNIGSIVNLTPFPATTAYAASKCAVDGMSEALAVEVGPLGIRVVLIDFGIFRTNFLHSFTKPKAGLGEAYVGGPVDATVSFLENLAGKQPGNPVLAAKRMVEVVDGTGLAKDMTNLGYQRVLRVPLGSDSFRGVAAKLEDLVEMRSVPMRPLPDAVRSYAAYFPMPCLPIRPVQLQSAAEMANCGMVSLYTIRLGHTQQIPCEVSLDLLLTNESP